VFGCYTVIGAAHSCAPRSGCGLDRESGKQNGAGEEWRGVLPSIFSSKDDAESEWLFGSCRIPDLGALGSFFQRPHNLFRLVRPYLTSCRRTPRGAAELLGDRSAGFAVAAIPLLIGALRHECLGVRMEAAEGPSVSRRLITCCQSRGSRGRSS